MMLPEAPTEKQTVGIVVITYNSAGVIDGLLDCVMTFGDAVQLVVVDNGSKDDTVGRCRTHSVNARVFVNEQNLGFSKAVRQGVSSLHTDFVLLLNPDARLDKDVFLALVDYLHINGGCGIVAPLVNERPNDRAVPAGWAPTLPRMISHMSGLSRFARRLHVLRGHYLLRDQVSGEMEMDWVSGACLLTRRQAWDEVDGMTTRWFMYAEDLDYCLRVRRAGWSVVLLGGRSADHAAGLSSAGNDGRVRTEWIVNLAELYDLHYGHARIQRITWRVVVGCGFLGRSLVAASRYDRERFRAYGAAVIGSANAED